MSRADEIRFQVDRLLTKATETQDLRERSRLIDEAARLNELALEADEDAWRRRRSRHEKNPPAH